MVRKFFKTYAFCFAAPAISAAVVLFVYARGGLYPFDDASIAYLDMYQQYVPLLYNLLAVISDWSNLFYSHATGGGMNFFGVFSYYLTPDSFLCLLFDKENFVFFVNILLILKIAAASFSASVCFKYCFKNLNCAVAAVLGILYGFCGYVMQIYQIIGWLNGLVIFPLVIISLYRLTDSGKYLLFVFSVVAAFFTNFYTALFIVSFGLMFSALKIFLATENKKRAAYTLLLSAMSAVLIGCVILLPCYFALNSSVRQSGIFHNVINGNPYDVNTYHFGALQTKITYLMCGAVALPSILLYLFDIKKHGRKGVFLLAALLLSLLPAFIEPVNVMWHFGSYALFPLRHGFIACFMLLFLSAAAFESIDFKYNDDAKPLLKNLASLALCLLAFCAFCYLFNGILNKYKSEIILSSYYFEVTQKAFKGIVILYLAAGAAYFLVMLAVRFKFLRIRMAAAVLALIAAAEAAANFDMFVASKKVGNDVFVSRIQLGEELNKTDGGYYRVKDHYLFDRHNFSLISGNSFNHYTSLTNRYAENALVKLGYTQSWFWISNMSGTVFSDSLLSHKYVISKEPIPNTYLEHTGQTADYQIYQNPYSFDMGIITKSGAFDGGDLTPVKYQNALYKHITGDDLFVFYDYSDTPNLNVKTKNGATYFRGFGGRIIYEIYVEGRQTLYFDIDTPYTLCLNVSVNDEDLVYSYPSSENNGILELGTFEDEDVSIELNLNMDIFAYDIELAGLPLDKMTALNNFVTTADGFNYGGGKYTITADNAEAGSFLTLSVPYDKGFTCYVNGKKRDIEITCGGFICVALDEGDNVVELKYFPPGMALGIAAAAAGIALLILTGFLFKRQNAPAINICYYIYAAAAALAAFIMVVFPLAAFIVKLFI